MQKTPLKGGGGHTPIKDLRLHTRDIRTKEVSVQGKRMVRVRNFNCSHWEKKGGHVQDRNSQEGGGRKMKSKSCS